MKTQVLICAFSMLTMVSVKANDTLFYENFNDYLQEAIRDTLFLNFDEDGLPDANGLPGGWFAGNFGNRGADSIEKVAMSSSWLQFSKPGTKNWLVLPILALGDDTSATLSWESAPATGQLYMDGYMVLISDDPDFRKELRMDIPHDTLAVFAQNMDDIPSNLSPGIVHARYDSAAGQDFGTGYVQYPGKLAQWSASLSKYASSNVCIAFYHRSDDDNYIALDDITVTGSAGVLDSAYLDGTGGGGNTGGGNTGGDGEDTSTTAIKHVNDNVFSMMIYPNPVVDYLTVKVDAPRKEAVKFQISDLAGRVVLNKEMGVVKGENTLRVDSHEMIPGTYMMKVVMGTIMKSQVLIKN